jgi:hypothetical protein
VLKKFSLWINKVSVWWVALVFMLLFIVFTATVVVSQSDKAAVYQGDAGSVDLRFWYTADDVFNMAKEYGQEGREAYIQARYSFDVIFPLMYVAFLATSISFLFGLQFETGNKWMFLNLVPIMGMVFDLLENGLAIVIMGAYPDKLVIFASIVPFMTMLKWIFVGGSFLIIIVLFFRYLAIKVFKK